MYLLFEDIKEKNKTEAVDSLIKDSTPKPSFFFLVLLSVLMATYGLLLDNASIIIGSMLIAPILSPILSLALGVTLADNKLISRSGYTVLKSVAYSIGLSALATWVLWNFTPGDFASVYNSEILSRIEPNIVYLFVAIIAGLATAFARVKPEISETLPGTAIAVALVPPLATIGIGVATFNLSVISGALSMFILNIIGIILASMVMFSLMNIYSKRRVAKKSLTKADKEQEKITKAYKKKKDSE